MGSIEDTTRVPEYDGRNSLDSNALTSGENAAGKCVLITGGASGIGEAMVKKFVEAGSFVTVGDMDVQNGKRVELLHGACRVRFVPCNVSSWEDQLFLFKSAIEHAPSHRLDIVIQNAGIAAKDPVWWDESGFDEDPLEPDLKVLETNLKGCLYTTKLALHYLARQPQIMGSDRCLILMSSIAGYCEQPGAPVYGASKHGIRGVMQSLRRTIHQRDMRINLLAPWYIETPALPKTSVQLLESKGVKFALASDAAQAALHIACDEELNGRCLAIVPRDEDHRGYMDMGLDDHPEGSRAEIWQNTMLKAAHRAASKDRQ